MDRLSARGGWGQGTATVGGKAACKARLFFILAPAEGANGPADRAGCHDGGHVAPIEPELLDFAVDLVVAAGEVTLRWFQGDRPRRRPLADVTPVTAADRAAERLVRERIADRFPDDGVLGEEEPELPGARDGAGSSIHRRDQGLHPRRAAVLDAARPPRP